MRFSTGASLLRRLKQSRGCHQRVAGYSSVGTETEHDVVIIGGGALGTSLAYHLAGRLPRVLLLERTELTAGSTWHAAGLTTYYHPGVNLKKIHYYSMEMYKNIEQETGQEVGLHQCGSLRIATTEERWQEVLYQQSRHGWHQAPQRVVDKDEVKRLFPLLNTEQVYGGLYNEGDGHIDPYSLTMALAAGARAKGAKIVQKTPVIGTEQLSDGGWRITTPDGMIGTRHVVNAAGFHAREVAKMANFDLPIVPIHHQYIIFKPQEETKALETEPPVLRDLEASTYVRLERGGLLVGVYELQELMKLCDDWYDNGPPPGFGKELFQGDLERVSGHLEKLMERIPCLEHAEVQNVVSGPITYSPDVLPMIGPAATHLRNYWLAAAFSYGIIHAGGMGKYLSDWIVNGEPPFDLAETDSGRYCDFADRNYVLGKCRESYGFNNLPSWPLDERPAARPALPLSPIYDIQRQQGAQFGFRTGYEVPLWFALPGDDAGYKPSFTRTNWFKPVQREVAGVLNGAGVIDISPFAKLIITGPDAESYVDYMFSNNSPKPGRTVVTEMLAPSGRVYSEHTVSLLEQPMPGHSQTGYLCITGGSVEHHDLRWMNEYRARGGYDVNIEPVTHKYSVLSVAGPKSRDILQPLTDADLSDEAFPYMSAQRIDVAGVPCLAVRISYTGELGWELYYEPCAKLYQTLLDTGSPNGLINFGAYAMNIMRIEKGFRMWGREMSMDNSPVDTGLMFFVKPNKTSDFIGKSAVKSLKEEGAKRGVVHVQIDSRGTDPDGSETVWLGDQVVGHVTSGCYSYSLQSSLAMVDLPIELCKDSQQVQVEILGEQRTGTVMTNPPVLTESMRKRQK